MGGLALTRFSKCILVLSQERARFEAIRSAIGAGGANATERILHASSSDEATKLLKQRHPQLFIIIWESLPKGGHQLLKSTAAKPSDAPLTMVFADKIAQDVKTLIRGYGFFVMGEYQRKWRRLSLILTSALSSGGSESEGPESVALEDANFHGSTLNEVLQEISSKRKSLALRFDKHGEYGVLCFYKGTLVDAICGNLRGAAAAQDLLTWTTSKLSFQALLSRGKRTIYRSAEELLEHRYECKKSIPTDRGVKKSLNSYLSNTQELVCLTDSQLLREPPLQQYSRNHGAIRDLKKRPSTCPAPPGDIPMIHEWERVRLKATSLPDVE